MRAAEREPAPRTAPAAQPGDARSTRARLARWCAFAGCSALVLACVLLFAREQAFAWRARPALCVALVDASDSVVARRPGWNGWVRAELERVASAAQAREQELLVLAFGANVVRVFGPAASLGFRAQLAGERGPAFNAERVGVERDASRLDDALALAAALVDQGQRTLARFVALGDRSFTGHDPRPALARIEARGAALEWIEVPPPELADFDLGALETARELERAAPIAVSVDVFAAPGTSHGESLSDYELALEFEHGAGAHSEHGELALELPAQPSPAPDGSFAWPVRIDVGRAQPGRNVIRVRLRVTRRAGAHAPVAVVERTASVACAGRLVVGVVDRDGGASGRALVRAHASAAVDDGLQWIVLERGELATALREIQVLVTCDIPVHTLPQALVASFVEHGGGWLCFGGDAFLADFTPQGAEREDELLRLLPLQPRARDLAPRDVVFLIDGSGSMSGAPFESVRRALAEIVVSAPRSDALELRFFSGELGPPIALATESGEERARALERVYAARTPGGPTALFAALDELVRVREARMREALIVLLSDGHDASVSDPAARGARLRERLRAAHARLSVIAAGGDADQRVLSALLAAGDGIIGVDSLVAADAAPRLKALFERELGRERVRSGTGLRVLPNVSLLSAPELESPAASVLRAQDPGHADAWPTIGRHLLTQARAGAEVAWIAERAEPLLALQRVGLGATAMCAFVPDEQSAPGWAVRNDLFDPLVRALGRSGGARLPRLTQDGDELVLDHLPSDAPAVLLGRAFAPAPAPTATSAVQLEFRPRAGSLDVLHERSARIPPELFTLAARAGAQLELAAAGEQHAQPLFELGLERLLNAEELRPRRLVATPAHAATATGTGQLEAAAGENKAGSAQRAPAPAGRLALVLLAAGMSLGALAALLGYFERSRS